MKCDELHVDHSRAGVVRECMSVAGIFPTVARDLISAPDPTGRQNDCLGAKNLESPTLALVAEPTDDAIAIFEQRNNRVLHVNVDSLMHTVILQRANHFQAGP